MRQLLKYILIKIISYQQFRFIFKKPNLKPYQTKESFVQMNVFFLSSLTVCLVIDGSGSILSARVARFSVAS